LAPGGGIDYRAFGNVWLRADYEYQDWPNIFGKGYDLDPQGVTVGAMYEFGNHRSSRP
jgi:opacity protein-like surface antigen